MIDQQQKWKLFLKYFIQKSAWWSIRSITDNPGFWNSDVL